ncbi:beta-ketoacyl synthase chain length factor [Paraburkholderia tropica]|uniref:beta-ketoacyl synthase chain length factor n=1 Tax=Paraburkholderia tropica TaxID=92647 RepID=UPI001CC41665|nr:beta-ketoacyl synthase chain length factor [Paraburkholderia tropica]
MPDLAWTLPVARWSFWSSVSESPPAVEFVDPMMRRRLSSLSRMALKVAGDCVDAHTPVRVVFASRHGELRRTTDILRDIEANKPVSPNAFSLSVLNAMSGLFGMARGDRSAATALSAGAETLGYALLEAHAQYADEPGGPILVIYADEPADARYGAVEHEVQGGALALLLDAGAAAQGRLACSVTPDAGAQAQTSNQAANQAPNQASVRRFATQSEALHHCLSARESAAWDGSGGTWQWSWHVGAA